MPSGRSSAEGWQLEPDSAQAYEQYLASAFGPWATALIMSVALEAGERVLDVACGTGIVARRAAPVAGPSGAVIGIDLNPDMLRVARDASAGVSPPIDWREGNAAALPFAAGSFDAVFCHQALAFFADPVRALAEMHRVLAAGGRAGVSVCRPIAHSPTYVALSAALDRHAGPEAGALMRSPFSRWSVDAFKHLFSAAGFRRVHVRIEVASLRYPSVDEFLRREAASSPLAGPIAALTDAARADLVSDLEVALLEHCDDDGVVCPIETYVAVAHR